MTTNLVIGIVILAMAQATTAPAVRPLSDPEAYAIYATLLPEVWKGSHSKEMILLVQETENGSKCRVPPLPEGWEGVQDDFNEQNRGVWALQMALPLVLPYCLIPRADIDADDARLAEQYPGIWQRRPGSLEFVAVSAVGFNASKTKALLHVRLRGSGQIYLMELHDGVWVGSKQGLGCGWGG
jgi:hypothetical protein